MAVCFILGIAWLATFYITSGSIPGLRALSNWNLVVGFALLLAGFGFAVRWR